MTSRAQQHDAAPIGNDRPISIVIADDNVYFRAGMVRALNNRADFDVVADVDDGAQAFEAIRRLRPDVALLDARMPVLDGLALTEMLTADPDCADVRVVLLSARSDAVIAEEARIAGAEAFLDKTQPRRQIGDAILAVARRVVPR